MNNIVARLLITAAAVILITEFLLFILKKIRPGKGRTGTVLSLLRSVIRYIAAVLLLCLLLRTLGFDPKSIAASVGIMALIIGFSAESLIEDMMTGVFMIFENQYNVGDILEVQGFRGTVTSIGIRTTSLVDSGGNIKIINNTQMKNILNRSDRHSKAVADIRIVIGPEFEAFEKKLPGMLDDIYGHNGDVFRGVPQYLGVQDIIGGSAVLRFAADVEEAQIYAAQRCLNHELLIRFMKEGVRWP